MVEGSGPDGAELLGDEVDGGEDGVVKEIAGIGKRGDVVGGEVWMVH